MISVGRLREQAEGYVFAPGSVPNFEKKTLAWLRRLWAHLPVTEGSRGQPTDNEGVGTVWAWHFPLLPVTPRHSHVIAPLNPHCVHHSLGIYSRAKLATTKKGEQPCGTGRDTELHPFSSLQLAEGIAGLLPQWREFPLMDGN